MALDPQRLAQDYQDLLQALQEHPRVNLVRVEGEPPEQYEIDYALQGLVQGEDGTMTTATGHRILIKVQFGYPHFPPTVKPLSPIFHPDFDPEAVRIADFWDQSSSLVDLVVHIGNMIGGVVYNLEEPFNQAAADWYASNSEQLPLDRLELEEEAVEKYDVLDEESFAVLDLDGEDREKTSPETVATELAQVREYLEQGLVFKASRLIHVLQDGQSTGEIDQLAESITERIRRVNHLFARIDSCEKEQRYNKALTLLERLRRQAVDFPDIDDLADRLEAARQQKLMACGAEGTCVGGAADTGEGCAIVEPDASSPVPQKEQATAGRTGRGRFTLPAVSRPRQVILLLTAVLVLGGSLLYLHTRHRRSQGGTVSEQVNQQAPGGHISGPAGKEAVQRKLDGLALAGKQLLDQGKVDEARNVLVRMAALAEEHHFKGQARRARTLLEQGVQSLLARAREAEQVQDWRTAIQRYGQALAMIDAKSARAREIDRRMALCRFQGQWAAAREAVASKDWDRAIALLTPLRQKAQAVADLSAQEKKAVERLLATSMLYQALGQARTLAEQEQWEAAEQAYEKILHMLREQNRLHDATLHHGIKDIRRTLLLVRIRRWRLQGEQAEQAGNLDAALVAYNRVIGLIRQAPEGLDKQLQLAASKTTSRIRQVRELQERQRLQAYLKTNYQQIFRERFPTFSSSRLDHPRVRFVRRQGSRYIFHLSCTEYSQGSSSRLALDYQYDTTRKSWGLVPTQ